jgi:hypothetical protein
MEGCNQKRRRVAEATKAAPSSLCGFVASSLLLTALQARRQLDNQAGLCNT